MHIFQEIARNLQHGTVDTLSHDANKIIISNSHTENEPTTNINRTVDNS